MRHENTELPTETDDGSLAPRRRSVLKAIAALGLGGGAVGNAVAQQGGEEDFVSLFDGESIENSYWHQVNGQANYYVEDGDIVGSSVPEGPNSFLTHYKVFDDFELRMEVMPDPEGLNSGIQLRSNLSQGKSEVHGPQVEIELSGENRQFGAPEAGYIYGESLGTGWLSQDRPAHEAVDDDGWNDFRVRVEDDTIRTWINGQQIESGLDLTQYDDVEHLVPWGIIGLQVHSIGVEGRTIRWRNIRINELDGDEWTSLFDGESTDGWTAPSGGGDVGVSDGAVQLSGDESFFVRSNETYDDFVFETWVRADTEAGLLFRNASEEQADGYRVDIDPSDDMMSGSLYDAESDSYLKDTSGEDVSQMAFHPDQWNYLRVRADGEDVRVWINGITTAGAPGSTLTADAHSSGHLGLQHLGGDGTVEFRGMSINPLDTGTGGGGDDTVSVPFGYDAGGGEIDGTVSVDGLEFVDSSPGVTVDAAASTGTNVGATSPDEPISGTENDDLFRTEGWGEDLSYQVDVENGTYDVTLYFAEIYFGGDFNGNPIDGGAGSRVFDVSVEDQQVFSELDIYEQVGHDAALVETVEDVEVTDGTLDIALNSVVHNSKLSGFAIRPAEDEPVSEIEVPYGANLGGAPPEGSSAESPVVIDGLEFIQAGQDFAGAQEALAPIEIVGDTPPSDPDWFTPPAQVGGPTTDEIADTEYDALYQTELFGYNLGFEIPIANGTYDVTLHNAEIFHGGNGNGGGEGTRVFDISVQGETVVENLDIYAEVGHDTAWTETVEDVEVTDGTLSISTTTDSDFSKFSAIEIRPAEDDGGPGAGDGEYTVPNTGGGTADDPAFTLLPEGDTFDDRDGDGDPSGAADLSADTYLGYDADNLYLRVEVTDDVHSAIAGVDMWQADSLQWAVASDGTYGPEYGLSLVDGELSTHQWIAGNATAGTSAIDASVTRDGTTTTYEATVPWEALFAEAPSAGDSFPFSVLINERDEDDSRDGVLGWTLPGISDTKTPEALGTLTLGDDDGGPTGPGGATDPDGDGRYEDINGDGEATYDDVVEFFDDYDESYVRDNPEAFDFNENGRIDFDDVVELFEDL